VPDGLAATLHDLSKVVSQGVVPVPEGTDPSAARAAVEAGHAAFMDGFHTAMLCGMAVVLAGALIAALLAPRMRTAPDGTETAEADAAA
jgi:hypothetical protein